MKHKSAQSTLLKKNIEIAKPASKLKRFSIWVGQQNAFLVIFVFFIILFGLHKVYSVVNGVLAKELRSESSNVLLQADKKKSVGEAERDSAVSWDEVKATTTPTTPSPSPTPSPAHTPTPSPISSPTPLPTTDPDPMIECTMSTLCGGDTVKMRRSECRNSVCCPVEPNKYESLSSGECDKRQTDYNNKKNEEYQKKLEAYEKYLQEFYATKAQENLDIQKQIDETNAELLEMCRENARKTYPEYPSGESPEHRNLKIQELNRCFNKYG